jgi:hypothetical protein
VLRASMNTLRPILVGALRFELRRPKAKDLQSSPDTVTGLDTQIFLVEAQRIEL